MVEGGGPVGSCPSPRLNTVAVGELLYGEGEEKKESVNIIHHYPPQQTLSGDPAKENLDKNKVVFFVLFFFWNPRYFTCWSLPWWADLRWKRLRPTFDTHPAGKTADKSVEEACFFAPKHKYIKSFGFF